MQVEEQKQERPGNEASYDCLRSEKTLKTFVKLVSLHVCREHASTTRLTSYSILSVANHKSGVKELITCNCAKIRAEKSLMTGITPYK